MLIGLTRASPLGAFLAWLGFTAPSALAMTLLAAALGTFVLIAIRRVAPWIVIVLAAVAGAVTSA